MGPPPKERASAGRINQAGIPYLYTAFNKTTTRREVGIIGTTTNPLLTTTLSQQGPYGSWI